MTKKKVAPSPEHRAAIDRLPTKPGTCRSCGDALVCVLVEQWRCDGLPHPPRFACAEHDVWLGDCVDGDVSGDGYEGGLYLAVLRDVADPAWRWLPEHMRAAGAKCGFGVRFGVRYPGDPIKWRITSRGGRAWVTDGRMMIDVGDLAEGEAMLDRSGRVRSKFDRAEIFRVPESALATTFETLSLSVMADVSEPDPAVFPKGKVVMVGPVAVEKHYLDFCEAVWPGIRWYVKDKTDPVFGMVRRDVRAVVMPICVCVG